MDDDGGETSQNQEQEIQNQLESFKPETIARKYSFKPETEKNEPVYKQKRARNNDAVRKNRMKTKEEQKKKDEEYDQMKKRIKELEGLLDAERKARLEDRKLIEDLLGKNGY